MNNIYYADYTVVIGDSQQALQHLLDNIVEEADEMSLKENTNGTKVVMFSKTRESPTNLKIYDRSIGAVEKTNAQR